MARDMHEKFDKYWGDIEKLNLMMFVAIVLDPRYKLRFVNFWFRKWNLGAVAKDMTKNVKRALVRMYEHYCDCDGYSNGQGQDGSSSNNVETIPVQDPHAFVKSIYKMHLAVDSLENKSKVERYLADCVEEDSPNFCILNWWKVNSSKYRLLSKVACDVLVIPLSTVASESAFSTGGLVLDPFRNSLLPNTVEMLICAQNWLRATDVIDLQESMEEVESYEGLELVSKFASQSTITVEEED
ncbi:zinc finger BED domain-containing protein RICESLEEPER 2-like [Castanea sativa]|uniref:zinc finger BED domain-containing protein RICESLEEPER 2-like n=1 Tax=Castanea sativa TaxID=21020 RepID=UPI003F649351